MGDKIHPSKCTKPIYVLEAKEVKKNKPKETIRSQMQKPMLRSTISYRIWKLNCLSQEHALDDILFLFFFFYFVQFYTLFFCVPFILFNRAFRRPKDYLRNENHFAHNWIVYALVFEHIVSVFWVYCLRLNRTNWVIIHVKYLK